MFDVFELKFGDFRLKLEVGSDGKSWGFDEVGDKLEKVLIWKVLLAIVNELLHEDHQFLDARISGIHFRKPLDVTLIGLGTVSDVFE